MNDSVRWGTPREYITAARRVLGEVCDGLSETPTIDPWTDPDWNPVGAEVTGTASHPVQVQAGGLVSWRGGCRPVTRQDWIWSNPPYDRGLAGHVARITEIADALQVPIVHLLPVRADTRWFRSLVNSHRVFLVEGRIRFITPEGGQPGNGRFASCLAFRLPDEEAMASLRFPAACYGEIVTRWH